MTVNCELYESCHFSTKNCWFESNVVVVDVTVCVCLCVVHKLTNEIFAKNALKLWNATKRSSAISSVIANVCSIFISIRFAQNLLDWKWIVFFFSAFVAISLCRSRSCVIRNDKQFENCLTVESTPSECVVEIRCRFSFACKVFVCVFFHVISSLFLLLSLPLAVSFTLFLLFFCSLVVCLCQANDWAILNNPRAANWSHYT